jgi:predicted amidophosphoribosyltransferase
MRSLSWQAFDQAMALSHRLELPLLHQARSGSLLVDDVYDTGLTLAPYQHLENSRVVVWICKVEPQCLARLGLRG